MHLKLGIFVAISIVLLLLLGTISILAIRAVPELQWRAELITDKAQGRLKDLSWAELVRWSLPGSPVYLYGLSQNKSPYGALRNTYFASKEHVDAGEQIYRSKCANCHGMKGEGASAPGFSEYRHGIGDWSLFRNITRGIPGTAMPGYDLPAKETWEVVAYLRTLGEAPQSDRAGQVVPGILESLAVPYKRLLQAETEPNNWLTFGGDYNSRRYSRLLQIDKSNVWKLRLEWAHQFSTDEATVQASPIVVDGVMFVSEPPNNVVAINASTGQTLWRYTRTLPDQLSLCCGKVNRGVAVLNERVYLATLDANLVALDSRSGRVLWDVSVADHEMDYSITAAPLAIKDMILVGIAGGEFAIRGFIDAYDAKTGRRKWRFYTVPGPGEPGHETWSGNSWKTGGAPTWLTGSYDPELNLVYWGTGNPGPVFLGDNREGDNLYSNCIIALDVDTGKLVWHYQVTPHDEHDWDAAHIPLLVDADFGGQQRKLMLFATKNAFYYVIDRETGEFLHAKAFAKQTWAERIGKDGRPVKRPGTSPSKGGTLVWPSAGGATNWWTPSFSPQTGLAYLPVIEQGAIYFSADEVEVERGEFFIGSASQPIAGESYAAIRALEAMSGNTRWEYRFREYEGPEERGPGPVGGILSTAGGVVFVGHHENFYAFDSETGELLWEIGTGGMINAPPVSFSSGDKQLVSIAAGRSIFTFGLSPASEPSRFISGSATGQAESSH